MKTGNPVTSKNVLAPTGMKRTAVCSLIAILLTLSLAIPVGAQIDPGWYDLLQKDSSGRNVKVGEIFVPSREKGVNKYVEHWVLFDNYVYPGAKADIETTIVPSRRTYASEADFFARVSWGPGFRYVRVDCVDTTRLPGR